MAPECTPPEDDAQDREAVARVAAGDASAFDGVVERYTPLLYSLAYRMLDARRETAEDAVQDILLKVFRALPDFDHNRRFFSWLYTIALNHLRSVKRKHRIRARRTEIPFETVASSLEHRDPSESPEGRVLALEAEQMIQEALSMLGAREREVFLLRHVEQLSGERAAEILGVPEATVRTILHRARKHLQSLLLQKDWP